MAGLVDYRRAKVMDNFILAGTVDQAQRPGDSGQLFVGGDREGPERGGRPSNLGMLAQDLRCVMVGVERDRDQPDLLGPPGKGTDRQGEVRELAVHVRTKL